MEHGKKASDLFLEFVQPLLDEIPPHFFEDLNQIDQLLHIPWVIWNSKVAEMHPGVESSHFVESIDELVQDSPEALRLVEFFSERKMESFNEYSVMFGDFTLEKCDSGELGLTIESWVPCVQ